MTLHGNVLTSDEAGELAAIQQRLELFEDAGNGPSPSVGNFLFHASEDVRTLLGFHSSLAARVAELTSENSALRDEIKDATRVCDKCKARSSDMIVDDVCLFCYGKQQSQRVAELEETNAGLRYEMTTTDHNVCQCLGHALNYPRYADDQANFPGATDADGVCVGEHVAETIAIEAVEEIERLRTELALRQNAQPDFDVLVAKYGEPEQTSSKYHEADYKWPNGLTWHVQREGESYARVNGSNALWTYDAIENALAAMKEAAK